MKDGVIEMSEKKSTQSWTISDEFWEAIKDEVPVKKRDPQKHYVHAPGQGTQADAGAESAGRDILCTANGLSMESTSTGVRQWEHST